MQLTRSEHVESSRRVDQLESLLLQEGTVLDAEELGKELHTSRFLIESGNLSGAIKPPENVMAPLEAADREEDEQQGVVKRRKLDTPGASGQSAPPSQTDRNISTQDPQPGTSAGKSSWQSEQDNVVLFHTGTLSPWDSDCDTQELELTPPRSDVNNNKQQEDVAILYKQVVQRIIMEGIREHRRPRTRRVRASVEIISDGFLKHWSDRDRKCRAYSLDFANLGRWTEAVRMQQIPLTLPITVVSLQCVKQVECLEPLRNRLAALCRAIRSSNPGGRIFITNNVPNPRSVPVLGEKSAGPQ